MEKKVKMIGISILIIVLCILCYLIRDNNSTELKTIKSEKQLSRIYNDEDYSIKEVCIDIATMPFSFFIKNFYGPYYYRNLSTTDAVGYDTITTKLESSINTNQVGTSTEKEYSTTNIQVENVDEADITKTDENYIYSISEDNVIITNVINPEDVKIEATIKSNDESIPEDLILYKDELVVIGTMLIDSDYGYNYNTIVKIYNIEKRSNPVLIKSYEMYEPYYTSRCIDNMLYVIASGDLREEEDKIIRTYKEDNKEKEIELENIKYLKDVNTDKQTIISVFDLDNEKSNIDINSYLIDISNAYVSEKSIYLLNKEYKDESIPISEIFGLKGLLGAFTYNDDSSMYETEIYKFNILEDGSILYNAKNKTDGKTINQYSLDEQNGHLRLALYDYYGTRVVIFDNNLNQIGESGYVAEGEDMYSSRFIGDKVYLVTYKTVDPLFVIDLSDETDPEVLGELKIPGYSTYLHPYDENHLIGIGMETEEVVEKNSSGKVISKTSKIIGMKMALFDVTDVNNPIQISQAVIGDRRTTSAILTNPKALLFSKEKQLIAIPVNNYSEDFEVTSSEYHWFVEDSYIAYDKSYIAEGYIVYNINLQDGFNLKGVITHEALQEDEDNLPYSYYCLNSRLLRGLYIDNNLYTISETGVKVNNIDTLELVDELKIK